LRNQIALQIGDANQSVIERGLNMNDPIRNVFSFFFLKKLSSAVACFAIN